MKVNRRKILNRSLKLLSTGVIAAAGVGVGAYIVGRPTNSKGVDGFFPNAGIEANTVDLDSLSCTLTDEFFDVPTDETIISTFATQNNLDYTNDLRVERDTPDSKTVRITTVPNSFYYEEGTYATVIWKSVTSKDWTSIYGSALISHLAVFEDTDVGRNALLADLAANYKNLDVSQLYIDTNEFDQTSKSANIRVVEGSVIYDSAIRGTVTAGFVQASDLIYDKPTISTNSDAATPTFKFKGTSISNSSTNLTYSISPAVSGPVSFDTSTTNTKGKITLASNLNNYNFSGVLYTITGTYVDTPTGNTYVSRSQVYVPPLTYDTGWKSFTINTSWWSIANGSFKAGYRLLGKFCTVTVGFRATNASSSGSNYVFLVPYTPSSVGSTYVVVPVSASGMSVAGYCEVSNAYVYLSGVNTTGYIGIYWTYLI